VSKFVKECQREWKRLGVADAVANEMAADLEADLEEAEAEGASIEDVLGSSAFDPRSFAAAWAAERGVVGPSTTPGKPARRLIVLATIVAAAIALIGAAIAFLPTTATHRVASVALRPALPAPPQTLVAPNHSAAIAAVHTVGLLLLVVGVIGIVTMSVWMLWSRAGRAGPGGSSYS
jgi:hypothetical protein